MIIGIGTDIVLVSRAEKACSTPAFLTRFFTEKERELIGNKWQRAASNFAVKESVSKCFGTGFRGFGLADIEVLRDELGKPYVNLYGGAKEMSDKLGIKSWYVTTSNEKEYAVAFVVAEG